MNVSNPIGLPLVRAEGNLVAKPRYLRGIQHH